MERSSYWVVTRWAKVLGIHMICATSACTFRPPPHAIRVTFPSHERRDHPSSLSPGRQDRGKRASTRTHSSGQVGFRCWHHRHIHWLLQDQLTPLWRKTLYTCAYIHSQYVCDAYQRDLLSKHTARATTVFIPCCRSSLHTHS